MHVQKETMKAVLAVNVGVVIMDNYKKPKDSLENHTIRNSTKEMDEKLNSAKKKLNERY